MLNHTTILALSLVTACGAMGCVEDAVAKVEGNPSKVEVAPATAVPSAKAKQHGQRKRRPGRDRSTPVYVDGKLAGSLRFHELPPTLPVTWYPLDGGTVDRRFAMGDYLTAMGVEIAQVKTVHLHGGRRITAIDGDEVRAKADKIYFNFTRNMSGRPAYRHDGPIDTNTSIDKIVAVAIYVNKPAPEMKSGTLFVDGVAQKTIPYTKKVKTGGTRVYVDGRIVGHLKRRHVEYADARDLASVLREIDVDVDAVKSAHIITRDKIARKLSPAELVGKELQVKSSKRGRLAVQGIADGQALDAILLFVSQEPVDRTVMPPEHVRKQGLRPIVDDTK